MGLLEDGCLKLRKLLEHLFKIKEINCKVSINTLETILCSWITAKFHDPSHCEFCEFLKNYLEKIIADYKIVIPINFLQIEKSFALGNVNFRPFSKTSIDELESLAVTQAQDSPQKDLVRKLFDQKIRQFQGYAVATILLQAEPARAYEIAIEETNTALSMLRIFSSSTREPLSYYPAAVWGSSNISKGYLIALKEGKFNQMYNPTRDRPPMSEKLNNQAIDDLYLAGLSLLDNLLGLRSKRNQFQEKLLAALILYSRSAISKDIADKLVYILVALESIFLRNSSEPIQQNLGERIAFLIGNSLEKRKRIIKVTRETYTLRSRFVHHGHSIDDDHLETMREFMQYAWQAIVSLIHQSNSVSTVDALLDMLDDRKFS